MSDQDTQHLDLLSLFHFILGGVTALFDQPHPPALPAEPPPFSGG